MREAAPRAVAALVVVALHVLALFLFLLPSRLPGIAVYPAGRETVLYLLRRVPPPSVRPVPRPLPTAPPAAIAPVWRNVPVAPPSPSESDVQGLGVDLFSCRPEDIGGLSLEQQMRCAHVGLAIVRPPPDRFASLTQHVRQRARWTTELARKKAPTLAPCFSHDGFSPLGTAFCIAEMAIDGYDQDNKEKYYLSN